VIFLPGIHRDSEPLDPKEDACDCPEANRSSRYIPALDVRQRVCQDFCLNGALRRDQSAVAAHVQFLCASMCRAHVDLLSKMHAEFKRFDSRRWRIKASYFVIPCSGTRYHWVLKELRGD
jgi:hypothetical protein